MNRQIFSLLSLKWLPVFVSVVIVLWDFVVYPGGLNKERFKALWVTPDQQAYKLFKAEKFQHAAQVFENPAFKASSFYRAGEFKKAAAVFASMSDVDARYNLANAYLMMGKYPEAIEYYDLALNIKPDFNQAEQNKAVAVARQEKIDQTQANDEGTGGQLEADEIVYDNKNNQGEEITEQSAAEHGNMSHWLERLQTSPGQFLKHKFAYQYARLQNSQQQDKAQ